MTKNLKNGIIIKRDLTGGRFIQTSTAIIKDKRLTDSALRLLQLLGDAMEGTKVSLSYYRKLLGWSKDKLSNAAKNLRENGYLQMTKKPRGEKNGFSYFYTISEYGNLKVEKDEYGNLINLPYTSHTRKNQAKSEANKVDSGNSIGLLTPNDYVDKTVEILETIPPVLLEEKLAEFIKIKSVDTNIQRFKKDVKKFVLDYKKECYKFYVTQTKGLTGEVTRIQNAYKDWLKEEIFDNNNFNPKYDVKWSHIKLQMKPRRTDYETSLLRD